MFPFDLLRGRTQKHDHVHYLTTLRGVLGMLRNPEGTESVFDIEDGLRAIRATRGVLDRVREDPDVRALMAERWLAPPVDLAALERLPAGTLGHGFARHILDHGFDPDYYRKIEVRDDLDWVLMRMRQTHDIWHVVTGIGTDRLGEIAVKAFELAQTWRPLAAVITCGGMMRYLMLEPERLGDVMTHISHGYQMGRRARPFLAQKWETGWAEPLAAWRERVGLPAVLPAPGTWPIEPAPAAATRSRSPPTASPGSHTSSSRATARQPGATHRGPR